MPTEKKFDSGNVYGIYTVGDDNFFAGIVASVNAYTQVLWLRRTGRYYRHRV